MRILSTKTLKNKFSKVYNNLQNLFAKNTGRPSKLIIADVFLISILRQKYNICTWKGIYKVLKDNYADEFNLPSYKCFIETMNRNALFMLVLIQLVLKKNLSISTELKFVDSSILPVCMNNRIFSHKVCKDFAQRGKGSKGYFYGFKIHLLMDRNKKIVDIKFTPGNVADVEVLKEMIKKCGKSEIFGDSGYVSKEAETMKKDVVVKAKPRKNMKKLATILDYFKANMRSNIESIFSVLKYRLGMATSLPRSFGGMLAHYIHILFGYLFKLPT